MKIKNFVLQILLLASLENVAQVNIQLPIAAENILLGNYDPSNFQQSIVISNKDMFIDGIMNNISADSLKYNLEVLQTFGTRNTGSDTVSATQGIGAARNWILSRFSTFGSRNENRLVTGFMEFDALICNMDRHKNVFAILPGNDTTKKDIVLVEAHYDSRCEGRCDVGCDAPGMDDNGSGTALVLELARVMSGYTFDRTIVFTTVTAEEQGLVGGNAWAKYIDSKNIQLLACLNNDVVGGVECGKTSSPPGCSPEGSVDSLNVRVFSYSKFPDTATYSQYKQLGRYIKLQQIEEINPRISIPMNVDLRLREDRDGRGGDHIPFRRLGLTSIRFSSSNEHGDGSGSSPDRQHTTTDSLGIDTSVPPDGIIDKYNVNFNYLARNTILNGVNLGMLASSPRTPNWELNELPDGRYEVEIDAQEMVFEAQRIGIRSLGSGTLYFDTVLEVSGVNKTILQGLRKSKMHFISVANVDADIESLFSEEGEVVALGVDRHSNANRNSLKVYPNPAVNVLNIETTNRTDKGTVEIYSSTGQMVLKKEFHSTSSKEVQKVGIQSLPTGNYHVFIFEKEVLMGSAKFVKSRH